MRHRRIRQNPAASSTIGGMDTTTLLIGAAAGAVVTYMLTRKTENPSQGVLPAEAGWNDPFTKSQMFLPQKNTQHEAQTSLSLRQDLEPWTPWAYRLDQARSGINQQLRDAYRGRLLNECVTILRQHAVGRKLLLIGGDSGSDKQAEILKATVLTLYLAEAPNPGWMIAIRPTMVVLGNSIPNQDFPRSASVIAIVGDTAEIVTQRRVFDYNPDTERLLTGEIFNTNQNFPWIARRYGVILDIMNGGVSDFNAAVSSVERNFNSVVAQAPEARTAQPSNSPERSDGAPGFRKEGSLLLRPQPRGNFSKFIR